MSAATKPYKAEHFRIKHETLKPTKKLIAAQRVLAKIMGDNFNFIRDYKDAFMSKMKSGASAEERETLYVEWNNRLAPDGMLNCISRRDVAWALVRRELKIAQDKQKLLSGPSSINCITPVEAGLLGNEYVDPGYWSDPKSKQNALDNRAGSDAAESRYRLYEESLERAKKRSLGYYVETPAATNAPLLGKGGTN